MKFNIVTTKGETLASNWRADEINFVWKQYQEQYYIVGFDYFNLENVEIINIIVRKLPFFRSV